MTAIMEKRIIALIICFLAAVIHMEARADIAAPDNMIIETKGFKNRQKGFPDFLNVELQHKKHIDDYKIACDACHHYKKLDLVTNRRITITKKCVACHTATSENIVANLCDPPFLQNAMHDACISCHRTINSQNNEYCNSGDRAPETCDSCHIPVNKN